MTTKTVCFISDAHFGTHLPGEDRRENRFFRFIDKEAAGWSELFLVGDIFDFWIEYRCSIRPDYFDVIHCLKKVVDSGVTVHYLAGNHDFALGPFLEQTIGINIYPGAITRELCGEKVYLFHGDGIIKADTGYRILKKLLRNPLNQRLYKLLHPNLGVPLGCFVSGSSRKYLNRDCSLRFVDEYRRCARKILAGGNDIVIMGHIHLAEITELPEGIYCNTGAWLRHYNYVYLKDGRLSLFSYQEGTEDELVASVPLK